MDGWMGGWLDGEMDGWMDEYHTPTLEEITVHLD